MSGTTRSMPNISSSGNISPQSITTISSPYSKTYMFLPISPTPPSGMMRSGVSLLAMSSFDRSEERELVPGIGDRLAGACDGLPGLGGERDVDGLIELVGTLPGAGNADEAVGVGAESSLASEPSLASERPAPPRSRSLWLRAWDSAIGTPRTSAKLCRSMSGVRSAAAGWYMA